MLPILTLALTGFTLCFALLSITFGNRFTALHTAYLKSEKETVVSEAASTEEMKAALETATVDVENVQQALDTEKASANRLRKQLSVVVKDLEKTRANLAAADRTITGLKSMQPAETTPASESSETATTPGNLPPAKSDASQKPTDRPKPQPANEPVSPPVAPPPPEDAPVVNESEGIQIPTKEAQTKAPGPQPEKSTPPAAAPIDSGASSPVTEETLTETPITAPAND